MIDNTIVGQKFRTTKKQNLDIIVLMEMVISEKSKKYTAVEKAKVALEAIKSELTMVQITSKYGVHATQIIV